MSTWKNSIGGASIGATAVASAALALEHADALVRRAGCTRSMTGGRSAVEYVWNAKRASGEIS